MQEGSNFKAYVPGNLKSILKATTGVGEAHLLQAYMPCVIGAITANLRRPPPHIPIGL